MDEKKSDKLIRFPPPKHSKRHLIPITAVYICIAVGAAFSTHALLARYATPKGQVALGTPRRVPVKTIPMPIKRTDNAVPPPMDGYVAKQIPTRTRRNHRRSKRHANVDHKIPNPTPNDPKETPLPQERAKKKSTPKENLRKPVATKKEQQEAPKTASKKPSPMDLQDHIDRQRATLNADSIRIVVRHYLPQVRACYDRALKQMAVIRGTVEIQFKIDINGRIGSSNVYRNTTGHQGLGRCLAVIIRRWRFPRPVGGEVDFIYPFVFSSGG